MGGLLNSLTKPTAEDVPVATPEAPAVSGSSVSMVNGVAKLGAGIMLLSRGEVLLLLRNSTHNNNTWGLPGGNADPEDGGQLAVTAQREAIEEMGSMPPFVPAGQIHTIRGKKDDKHYTVFLCAVTDEVKKAFVPALNYEHSAWRWFSLEEAFMRLDLHPVVERIFRKTHRQQVLAAAQPM